ncbi:Poly [ADP-ribose] polymerase 3 [Rhizophlyctis rosea]|nr:Poly [ADP-ribose] polymerase 3 [Rhizophlyctis rosea]
MTLEISKMRVVDLRAELSKRNLDTTGLKDALVKRLTEALADGDTVMEDASAESKEPNPEEEPKPEEEQEQTVRRSSRSKKAPAAPVAERVTTKSSRKRSAPTPPDEPDQTNPQEEEVAPAEDSKPAAKQKRGKKRKTEDEKHVTTDSATTTEAGPSTAASKPKGTPKVDPCCPLDSNAVVYTEGDQIYDVMLNQVNIGQNNNKFYVIQLLLHHGSQHYTFTRWGRVGENGQQKLQAFPTLDAAKKEFAKKFKDKSANVWSADIRDSFEPVSGKYTLLEMSYEDDDAGAASASGKGDEKTLPCSLDPPTASLMGLIFDDNTFKQQMKDFNIDTERMPLGKLSRSTIENGRKVLVEIQRVVNGETKGDLSHLSSQFYTYIPHAYGRGTVPPILRDADAVQKKIDLCNVLADIEIAQSLKKAEEAEKPASSGTSTPTIPHPLDLHYHSLKCKLNHISKTSSLYSTINTYLEQTRSHTGLTLVDCWEADREGEDTRFAAHDDIKERKLLWHGTNVAVVAAILATGLRIMPHAGGRVGRGLYFASENAKSAGYTSAGPDGTACMFLAEVALGKQKEINRDDSSLRAAPAGYGSVVARGHTEPDPKYDMVLKIDGKDVVVPQGKAIDMKEWKSSSFWHSEYLVYKESQVRLRYVLRVKLY